MANYGLHVAVLIVVASVVSANTHFPEEESRISFANRIDELLRSVKISSECDAHLQEYRKGLMQGSIWALQMFDAQSKFPTGLFEGNFADLGAFDECINVDAKMEESKNIYGQYCLGMIQVDHKPMGVQINMSMRNPSQPEAETDARFTPPDGKMGLARCVPHTCSLADINQIYSNIGLRFYKELCQTKRAQPELDGGTIATISFFGVILSAMMISTAYDALIQYYNKKPHHPIFIAFSILTNGKKLITTSDGPNQISCLHGIRVISTMWVILVHKYNIQNRFPSRNDLDVDDLLRNQANMFIIEANVSIDTFFLMGGLVIVYVYMSDVTKGVKFNIFMYYIHRYLRLTPVFAVIILIHVTLIKHVGSGPLWPSVVEVHLANDCQKYWWKALLYIQNYGQDFYCVPQSWYLSVDVQLFLLSPILLIPLSRWPVATLSATGFLTVCSMVTCFLTGWFYEFDHSTLGNGHFAHTQDFMRYYYVATQTRAAPWLIGLIAGYFIFQIKHANRKFTINKVVILLIWGASLAVLCTCVFAGHGLIFGEYDKVLNSIHLGFVRPAWAIAVGSIIFLCVIGYGGPVDWFLSLPIFQVISKFTYTLYLTHYFVIYITTGQMRDISRFSSEKMMYLFWADFVFCMVVSVILTLAFELPIITIENALFGESKKKSARPPLHEQYGAKATPIEEA